MIYLLPTVDIKFRTPVYAAWEAIDVRMTNGEIFIMSSAMAFYEA